MAFFTIDPSGTWCLCDITSTLMQCHEIASIFSQYCLSVMTCSSRDVPLDMKSKSKLNLLLMQKLISFVYENYLWIWDKQQSRSDSESFVETICWVHEECLCHWLLPHSLFKWMWVCRLICVSYYGPSYSVHILCCTEFY